MDRPISEFIKEEYMRLPQAKNQYLVTRHESEFGEAHAFYRIEKVNQKSYRIRYVDTDVKNFFADIPQLSELVSIPSLKELPYYYRVSKENPVLRLGDQIYDLEHWSIDDELTQLR